MKIVCDSGSTKADWVIIDKGREVFSCSTRGINPVFHDAEFIHHELNRELTHAISPKGVKEVYFYGAGCWDFNLKGKVEKAIQAVFAKASIEVDHDLLGAARAACGSAPGIACILGTGSNSCLYDGENVVDNVTNLGYLIGDEGSGSYLGKSLLRSYFYRELPKELEEKFKEYVPGGKAEVLENIYGNSKVANVYLASFAPFLSDNKKHFFIEQLVHDAFLDFINAHVSKYRGHLTLPINFIGSVAYHFSDVLEIALTRKQMTMGKIVRKPIKELVKFHLKSPKFSD